MLHAIPIQAHRSAGIGFPENTLESCLRTWTHYQGRVIPEMDISTTRDGVIVGFHDKDLARVVYQLPEALQGKTLSQLTWQEARQLDVGGTTGPAFVGQRIALIEDVFRTLHAHPEWHLYLDYKSADLPTLATLARNAGVNDQLILASRHHDILVQWSTLLENARTMIWIPHGGNESVALDTLQSLRDKDFRGLSQIQLHTECKPTGETVPSLESLRALAAELAARDILLQSFPYTGRFGGRVDPAAFRTLLDTGVRSFATDYVDDALGQVDAFIAHMEKSS